MGDTTTTTEDLGLYDKQCGSTGCAHRRAVHPILISIEISHNGKKTLWPPERRPPPLSAIVEARRIKAVGNTAPLVPVRLAPVPLCRARGRSQEARHGEHRVHAPEGDKDARAVRE